VEEITITIRTCEESGTLVASWDDPRGLGGLSTQADKLSDLEGNIREAIAVHFEPEEMPRQVRLHFLNDRCSLLSEAAARRFRVPMSFGHLKGSVSPYYAKQDRT